VKVETSVAVTGVLELPAWTLVYSEVAPEAATYSYYWSRRIIDFTSSEPISASDLVAQAREVITQYANILQAYVYQAGTEEEGERWLADITIYPRPDLYPGQYATHPSFWQAFLWGLLAGGIGLPILSDILSKSGSDGGGGGGMTDVINVMMPMMMVFMMMGMIMPMMTARS
jgi:hypothetical protein